MSVTINGTSGVTTPGIANSEGYTGDGLTIAAGAPAGAITINSTYQTFSPNGSEAMRLDASGNLGLGVTPSAWANSFGTIQGIAWGISSDGSNSNTVDFLSNAYRSGASAYTYIGNSFATRYRQFAGQHAWFTAPSGTAGNPITFTQAMTLDSSGNLLVGTTSVGGAGGLTIETSPSYSAVLTWNKSVSGNVYAGIFKHNGTTVGSIEYSNTATSYVTSSDYRLKENVAPLTNALDKIASLKPCTFTWKADGSADRGFIAHELQEVIPQAVSGEKDAVDDEGNIMPQGVDYGKITPEIVAALQEAYAIITELKARIEQLEAK